MVEAAGKERQEKEEQVGEFLQTAVVQYLLEDTNIPREIRESFWGFVSRTIALSNLTESDIEYMENKLIAAMNILAMSKPEKDWTVEDVFVMQSLAAWLRAQLRRGFGGFERRMSATSITLRRVEFAQEEPGRRGFFSKLFRR